ncbi:hypothetical protein [Maribacter sp. HTCC2170]|uniref:hypothetical protein n=1 Tax=Maribacter sp. (strain HTCC2170 / KCCM 42371) TaxID=313603 RepID=UPI00006BD277|nr:hypothetical protein [Maribacter sp. HTCC2170]EAR02751.1 hypothetical protein FB2170_05670 [Maribacter sp. HTCC2170]
MKFTQDQIQELFKFTRKHYVEHYDVQTELVDHLANGIEEQISLQPKITFKEALNLEFKKFGVFGFQEVINKKTNAMSWRYWKIIFQFYKEYFKLPKLAMTVTSILVVTALCRLIPMEFKHYTFVGILFAIEIILFVIYFRNRNNYQSERIKDGKKWMLKDQIYSFANSIQIINLFPIMLNLPFFSNYFMEYSFLIDLSFALLVVCLIVFCYVVVKVIPQKAVELLSETYPEYNMVT